MACPPAPGARRVVPAGHPVELGPESGESGAGGGELRVSSTGSRALAGCFAPVEPQRQARKYVTGLISDLPRKNCWALAEQAGDATPDKMQRLLERAAWDALAAMRGVRGFTVMQLGDPAGAVLVIDESGQEKAGEHTAGVKC